MNPLFILPALFAAAVAAPTVQVAYNKAPLVAATGYAKTGVAVAPAAVAVAPTPLVHAAPAPIVVPDPVITEHVIAPATTSIAQPPPVIRKELSYGKQQFVSGYSAGVIKPAIPDFRIAVPTVLKGSVATNPAIVKNVREPFIVNEPVPVERPYNVPYDVPVVKEVIEELIVPVPVDKPYNVPQPFPVQGEPIYQVRRTEPIIQKTAEVRVAPAVYNHVAGIAPVAGIAAVDAAVAPVAAVAPYSKAVAPLPAVAATGYAKQVWA